MASASLAALFLGVGAAAAQEEGGAALFKKACSICHAAEKNAAPRQGPNLLLVFGRKAGSYPGFAYSAGFLAASKTVVWNEASLDQWLADPRAMMPGSVMLYKQPNAERRAALIKYLKTLK
ncbi:MAG: c-type cytochrome [Alphaproteobacteria bacterium]